VNARLAVALALCATGGGCVVHDDDDDYYYEPPPSEEVVETVAIDEGGVLDADPGQGVGVFVEYLGAGSWHVWTTCDSEISGAGCSFDLYLDAWSLDLPRSDDLEVDDFLDEQGDSLHASFYVTDDTDGVTVEAEPDEPLRLEVWLDGAPDARFVYWVYGGEIYQGAPSNPVDFFPG
jgi:hypothetical protein